MREDDPPLEPLEESSLLTENHPTEISPPENSSEVSQETWETLDRFLRKGGENIEGIRERIVWVYNRKRPYEGDQIANEALMRTVKFIGAGKQAHENIQATIFTTARNVWLELIRSLPDPNDLPVQDDKDGPPPIASGEPNIEEKIIKKESDDQRRRCMRKCFYKLTLKDRKFLARYSNAEDKAHYAAEVGLNPAEARMKAFYLRQEIRKCSQRCLKTSA